MKVKLATHRGKGTPLTAQQIFWNFAKDTLLTGAIYLLLVGVSLALKYSAHSLEDSRIHHIVLVILEYLIFFSGSFVALAILIYVTVLSTLELASSFKTVMSAYVDQETGTLSSGAQDVHGTPDQPAPSPPIS